MRWPFSKLEATAVAPCVEDLGHSLDEALRWCRPRFSMYDLERSLRSPELKPSAELGSADAPGDVVNAVVNQRRELLKGNPPDADPDRIAFWGHQAPGEAVHHNLLAVFPTESLSDGTSPPPTGGFIDVDDVPAWDTWVYFGGEMLVTLVPPELVSAVEIAIDCNACDCIGWLGFRDHPLVDEVRKAGLSCSPSGIGTRRFSQTR